MSVFYLLCMVVGAIALSLFEEGRTLQSFFPTPEPSVILSSHTITFPTLPASQIPAQVETSVLPGVSPTPTSIPPTPVPVFTSSYPSPTPCPIPIGWQPLPVVEGETLKSIAKAYGLTPKQLMRFNCLEVESLIAGSFIYVPFLTATPTLKPTSTRAACVPPPGWIIYIIRPGDTLSRLAGIYGVTVAQLKQANCLVSDFIRSGDLLYVPNVATRTPSPTHTKIPSATLPPSRTPTWTYPPVFTPTRTFTPTPEPTLTRTASNSPTATSTRTNTPLPTFTSTPTDTPTETDTPTPPPTSTPTFTFTPTETPVFTTTPNGGYEKKRSPAAE